MRRLELDLHRPPRRSRLAVFVLAAFAVAFVADTALRYRDLKDGIAERETRIAARGGARHVSASASMTADEVAYARDTLGKLVTPWDRLFRALEAAQSERVALLAIEPDAANRTVSISGQAKDYLAVLTYVARLADQGTLGRVHLARHEVDRKAGGAVIFTVSASWKDSR
jgi:hypothetical protein